MEEKPDLYAVLASIVSDMHDWPQHQDAVLHSVQLLALVGGSAQSTGAVVLLHSTDDAEGMWWTLIRLHKRHVNYFKRVIWFYLIEPDRPLSPYEGYEAKPTAAEISNFIEIIPEFDCISEELRIDSQAR